ncbi:MAG TPA: amidohydrolase family protein, partial [Planctomycetota bacterium]|nr:amidohydrolase family protein [Planctomycetota bacterium]
MRLAGGMLALVFAQASGALVRGGGEPQRDFVLRAGALHPGDGEVRRDVAIVVRGGRIEGVLPEGAALPSELPVVDRRDAFVTPGLVVADAGTGLTDVVFEERARGFAFGTYHVFRTVDPLREAIDGFSFEAPRTSLLAAGVTTVYLSPGLDRLVNGRGAVVKTAGSGRESRTLRATADLAISIGDDPQDPPDFVDPPLPPSAEHPLTAPKRQMPRTRASAPYALRLAFENAIEHAKAVRAARAPGERPPLDPELSALAAALKARAAVRIRTSGESDVPAALSLLRDYELPGALVGCARAEAHAKAIAEAGVPAIVELSAPSGRSPANVPARANDDRPRPRTAAELAAAGVRIAIVPADDTPTDEFPLVLARAVAGGLAPGSAVRAATYEPARILGVEDRVGSIAPGRDADFVVWNGEPGSASTSVRETWVAGVRAFDRTEGERRRRDAQREVAPLGSVVVRAGLVLPMAGEPIRDGAVSVYDGRIIGVGRDVPVPPGVRVIDAGRDAVITPGLIDARSFLGLDGDSGAVTGSVPLEHLAVPREPDFRRVAEGGVTTVLVQGVGFASSGTPVAALKTGGSTSQAVVREVCGVGIPSMGSAREAYRNLLVRGKQYSERWDKYFADVDRQRDEERRAAAEGKKPESAPAEAAPAPSRAEEDPLSGTWEGTLHGGPLPRPVTFTLKLVLKNGSVSGTFSGRGP